MHVYSITKNMPLSQITPPAIHSQGFRFGFCLSTSPAMETITQIINTIVPNVALSG